MSPHRYAQTGLTWKQAALKAGHEEYRAAIVTSTSAATPTLQATPFWARTLRLAEPCVRPLRTPSERAPPHCP